MLDLAGVWTLSDESGAHVLPFDLPGDGITALHRAAEMGEVAIAELLLDRGAFAHSEAQGHTPRSLAIFRDATAVVALLDSRSVP